MPRGTLPMFLSTSHALGSAEKLQILWRPFECARTCHTCPCFPDFLWQAASVEAKEGAGRRFAGDYPSSFVPLLSSSSA